MMQITVAGQTVEKRRGSDAGKMSGDRLCSAEIAREKTSALHRASLALSTPASCRSRHRPDDSSRVAIARVSTPVPECCREKTIVGSYGIRRRVQKMGLDSVWSRLGPMSFWERSFISLGSDARHRCVGDRARGPRWRQRGLLLRARTW